MWVGLIESPEGLMISRVIRFMKQRLRFSREEGIQPCDYNLETPPAFPASPTDFELTSSHNPMSQFLKVIPPYFIHIYVHVYVYIYIYIFISSVQFSRSVMSNSATP